MSESSEPRNDFTKNCAASACKQNLKVSALESEGRHKSFPELSFNPMYQFQWFIRPTENYEAQSIRKSIQICPTLGHSCISEH